MMTTQSTPRFCEFCGAELKTKPLELFGGKIVERVVPCPCEGSVEAIQAAQRAENDQKRIEAQRRWERDLRRAGIRPRYWGKCQNSDLQSVYSDATSDGLYIWGEQGRGKTSLACEIGKRALREKQKVLFVNVPSLMRDIRNSYSSNETSAEEIVQKCINAKLLILDDLGQENATKDTVEIIYEIVNERDLDMAPMVVTSNLRRDKFISHYSKQLGNDEVALNKAKSIVSRLSSLRSYEVKGSDHRIAR